MAARTGSRLGLWLCAGILGGLLWATLWLWEPAETAGFSICLFRRIMRISCPGCGLTRAMAHLAKGELGAGFSMHPLAPLLAVEGALAWLGWGYLVLRGRPLPGGSGITLLIVAHAVALALLWLGRLFSGTLPPG